MMQGVLFFFMGLASTFLTVPAEVDITVTEAAFVPDDVVGHEFENEIVYALQEKYFKSDGDFLPDKKLNRAEFVKTVVLAAAAEEFTDQVVVELLEGDRCYKDVEKEDWFFPYICYANDQGFIDNDETNDFKPGDRIRLIEALKILFEAFEIDLPKQEGANWYVPYMSAAKLLDLDLGKRQPFQDVTKGELAYLIRELKDLGRVLPNVFRDTELGMTMDYPERWIEFDDLADPYQVTIARPDEEEEGEFDLSIVLRREDTKNKSLEDFMDDRLQAFKSDLKADLLGKEFFDAGAEKNMQSLAIAYDKGKTRMVRWQMTLIKGSYIYSWTFEAEQKMYTEYLEVATLILGTWSVL